MLHMKLHEPSLRKGFTLVELLVVIAIILTLSILTYSSVNYVIEADRVKNGARLIESMLKRARAQAIATKTVRGIRLYLDADDASAVSSLSVVGVPADYTSGTVNVNQFDESTLEAFPVTAWQRLVDKGLLVPGARIKIENNWHYITFNNALDLGVPSIADQMNPVANAGETLVQITNSFSGTTNSNVNYILNLNPVILPNQEIKNLGVKTLIDLDESKIPSVWIVSTGPNVYTSSMDILFSPEGRLQGDSVSDGLIHLLVADQQDISGTVPLSAGDPTKQGDEFIVSISPLTGNIGTYQVYSLADPYQLAEEGRLAK